MSRFPTPIPADPVQSGARARRLRRTLPIVVAFCAVLAACGSDTTSPAAAPQSTATPAAAGGGAPDEDRANEASSCPAGYSEFNGNYPLRLCHKGTTVEVLQSHLVALGYDIEVDGFFGPATQKALAEEFGDGIGEIRVASDMESLRTCDEDC